MRMSRGPTATTCAAWARTHVGALQLSATEASGWRDRHRATRPPSSPSMPTLSMLGPSDALCGAEAGRTAAAGRHLGHCARPAGRACWDTGKRERGVCQAASPAARRQMRRPTRPARPHPARRPCGAPPRCAPSCARPGSWPGPRAPWPRARCSGPAPPFTRSARWSTPPIIQPHRRAA
jgi:hypothetical protein